MAVTDFDTKVAVVVRDDLAAWQRLNVCAFLMSGVVGGAGEVVVGPDYEDGSGRTYLPMLRQPVLVFESSGGEAADGLRAGGHARAALRHLHGRPLRDGPRRRQPRGRAGGAERGARPRRARAAGAAQGGRRRRARAQAPPLAAASVGASPQLPWRHCPAVGRRGRDRPPPARRWTRGANLVPHALPAGAQDVLLPDEGGRRDARRAVVDEEDKYALIAAWTRTSSPPRRTTTATPTSSSRSPASTRRSCASCSRTPGGSAPRSAWSPPTTRAERAAAQGQALCPLRASAGPGLWPVARSRRCAAGCAPGQGARPSVPRWRDGGQALCPRGRESGSRAAYRGMPRKPRREVAGGIFHVFARGVDRRRIFLDDHDRAAVPAPARRREPAAWAGRASPTASWAITSICSSRRPSRTSATGMRRLHGTYAQTFNERYARTGHLFERRFNDRPVATVPVDRRRRRVHRRQPGRGAACTPTPDEFGLEQPCGGRSPATAPSWLDVDRLAALLASRAGMGPSATSRRWPRAWSDRDASPDRDGSRAARAGGGSSRRAGAGDAELRRRTGRAPRRGGTVRATRARPARAGRRRARRGPPG